MRSFLILCSVISVAHAASLAYNYQNNGGGGVNLGGQVLPSFSYSPAGPTFSAAQNDGFGFGGTGASGSSNSAPALGVGFNGGQVVGGQGAAGPSYSAGVGGQASAGPSYNAAVGGQGVAGPSYSAAVGGQGAAGPSYNAPAVSDPEYTKEFYSYTAPEYEFNDVDDNGQVASSLKKNLRVVFIKGPENSGLENAALQLAKSASEERTAIYVLTKQADVGDLANKFQSFDNRNSNKPEVHFVKYKSPADAENAQRSIQAQYDGLSGPTSSHNGVVAPVLDFASKAPAPVAQQSYAAAPGAGGNVESSYLPPNKRA